MEILLQAIHERTNISDKLEKAIEANFAREDFTRNFLLLREHQFSRKLFFLEKGTVRTFYYYDEKDVSSWFYFEGQFFTSWYSFYTQQSSFENIETLEATTVYSIDYFAYQKLLNEFPKFERFGNSLSNF